MLQQLRKASKSWVASAIIGVLVMAFALWGVADIFRGGIDTVVADVGSVQVSSTDYSLQLRNQMRNLSAQTQTEITMDQAKAIGLDKSVLDQAVNRAALDNQSRRLGLTASVDAIRKDIQANNAFRGASGAFDPFAFQRMLQDSGLTENGFVAEMGNDIARTQMINATSGNLAPPPGLVRLLYDYVNEQRTVEYLVMTPEEAGQVPEPSQADLEAYHKANGQRFSSPEYRSVDYVLIGPDQVSNEIEVSDADVKAEYEAKKDSYNAPETRDIEQIAFPSKDEAEKAAMRIKTAADFLSVARERGLKDEDLKLGTFTTANINAKLSQAAFSTPQGGVTPAIDGPFGWVVLHVAKVTPGVNRTFDEMQDQIRADLIKARAAGRVVDLANMFEDARGGGGSLSDAAMKVGLTVVHVAAVDREGMTPERTKAEIPAEPQFLQQVFETETGEETDLVQMQDGVNYALKLNSVTPPAVRPLDSVREEVREAYIAEQRTKLLQTKVQAFVEQAKKDGNLAGVGKALGHAPMTSKPLTRGQTDDVFAAALLGQLFAQPPGNVVTGPAGKGNGVVIARVVSVAHPEPDVSAAPYAQFRQSAAQQLSATAVDSLAAASRKEAGVTIHDATVQQILGETTQ